MTPLFYKKICRLSFFVMTVLIICSCTPIVDNRGNFPEEKKLSEIIPGKTSSLEVETQLGSPSSRSTFGDEIWYYISSKQQRFAFYETKELERKVLAITFDTKGIVSDLKFHDFDDAINVDIAKKETKTYGHSIGFLEQFIGNLGRFESPK